MHLTNEIPEDTSKRIKTKLPDKQLQGIEAHDLQIYWLLNVLFFQYLICYVPDWESTSHM